MLFRSQALAGVVAGGDFFGAQAHGVVQKGLELDFGVAQHVRVGRAAGLIFAQKLGKHAVFVVGGGCRSCSVHTGNAKLEF